MGDHYGRHEIEADERRNRHVDKNPAIPPRSVRDKYFGAGETQEDVTRRLEDAATNALTPGERELIEMLAEEAGEIVQACMKILRHGKDSYNPTLPEKERIPNVEHLRRELDQLRAIEWELEGQEIINLCSGSEVIKAWKKKLKYTHFQQEKQP